ncbi:sensor histidine kinase [Desnuesiella massiliensis]|uniref:sensor histidine kinase n=1 Tax=Desnuesiella massiliensis TaxID=1650662 RepID=UPI0006E161C6|nr:sensor histidine kinase [Desnuesiella massiliensis]
MRNRIKSFLIDRLVYIIFMVVNSLLLTAFYSFTIGQKVEIIYPFIITLFLMTSLLIIDWFRYSGFYKDIQAIQLDRHHRLRAWTREQKEMAKAIKYITLKHEEKEQELLAEYKNKIYFLSGAIHKFKNYISVIGLIIEKNKSKNEELQLVLKDIAYENDNLYDSLEQVLNYIRLDSFSNDFDLARINLYDEIKSIINTNRNAFINNNVFPVLECEDRSTIILTDKKWNRVVIEQIITNAIKYSSLKKGNKSIYFNIKKQGNNTFLTIKDEGVGISDYDLKKVFEPFFTGENGRKLRNSTGIGLYIAREVAWKLNHEISAESKVNIGTEVTLKYLSKM